MNSGNSEVEPVKRFTWLGLNADGLLVAGLALFMGLDLFAPHREDLAEHLGYVPGSFYVWTAAFVVGGGLMVFGFATTRLGPELFGRLLVAVGAGLQAFRIGLGFGWVDFQAIRWYTLFALILVLFLVRARALLARKGVAVVIGGSNGTG